MLRWTQQITSMNLQEEFYERLVRMSKTLSLAIVKAIGGLVFSLIDGALFVSTGDGSSYNSVDSHAF